jgi:hypothetical protein
MTAPFPIRHKRDKAYLKQAATGLFSYRRRMIGLTDRAPIGMTVIFGYDKWLRRYFYLLVCYNFLIFV